MKFFHQKKVNDSPSKEVFDVEDIELISDVSTNILSTLTLNKLLEESVKTLVKRYKFLGGILLLKKGDYISAQTISSGLQAEAFLKLIGRPLSDLKIKLNRESNNYIVNSVLDAKVYIGTNLSDFTRGVLSENISNIAKTITFTRSCISVPIIFKEKSLGALFLSKTSSKGFDFELPMLNAIAKQLAIAITNAELYEESQNQVIQLTNKNKELTSLYNLASNVSLTLDPRRVSQAAVDSLPQDEKMLGAILASLDDSETKLSVRAVSQNQLSYQVEKILGGFDRYSIDINEDRYRNNAYVKVIRAGSPYFTNDINEAFNTVIPQQLLTPISSLLGIKSLAIYPIKFRTKTVGVITYLIKDRAKEDIDTNQQQLLATYSTQISVALENANLFTKSQVIQQNLENALKQLETLRNHERDMIDIMGHELRTPMSIVRNALVMLSEIVNNDPELNRNEKVKKYTDIGLESARREVTLIETLLSATKADGKGFQLLLEKVNMVEVVDASVNAFSKECEKKGLYLKYEKPTEDMFVYTDRTRVQEISDNFLSNATKYTLKGGIEIKMYKENGFVFVDYLDTGMGISEDDIKRLGNKFFRAKQYLDDALIQSPLGEKLQIVRPGGTGLGLYVTFNLIKILDGRLFIKSKLKVGSKFTFGMPIYSGQPQKQIEKKVEVFEAKPVKNTII